jgi:hypothetical protein
MKLTRKKAIEKHREMWGWLYKNPGKEKWEWPDLDKDILHDCYLCEYAIPEKEFAGKYCEIKCPLKWPDGLCSVGGDGLFDKWWDTTCEHLWSESTERKKYLKKEIKRLAKKIRDLPER